MKPGCKSSACRLLSTTPFRNQMPGDYLEDGLDLGLGHRLGGLEDVGGVHETGEGVEAVVDAQVRRLQVWLYECLQDGSARRSGGHPKPCRIEPHSMLSG